MEKWILLFAVAATMTGCAVRDAFPMRNPATGEEVVCYSGAYTVAEGAPQMRIAEQCFSACERYGFRRFTGNPYTDAAHPRAPDPDVVPFIPKACLP